MSYRFRTTARLALLVVTLFAATIAVGSLPRDASAARQVALGVSMLPDRDLSVLDRFTASIGGHAPASWSVWSYWGDSTGQFDAPLMNGLKQRGVTPLIWWMSADPANLGSSAYTYTRISSGDHDAYIRNWATAAKQYGSTILLRFDHEMDGTWFAWGATRFDNTPAKFIAAWRHVVGIFRSVGATNVKFLWSPYTPQTWLYPGDSYVDYVGFTRFNWGSSQNAPWTSMYSSIKSGYTKARQVTTNRPVIVTEMGSTPIGGDKAIWIRNGYPAVYANFSAIKGLIYFNINMAPIGQADWSLTNPPGALAAYAAIAADTRFQGRFGSGSTTPPPTTSTTIASDSYGRVVQGSWGSTTPGGTYSVAGTASDFAIGSGIGTMKVAAGLSRSALLPSAKGQNVDLSFRVATDKVAGGDMQFVYGVLRRVDSLNEYRVKLRFPTNGTVQLQVSQLVGGHESAIGSALTVPGLAHTAGSFIRLRAQITGSNPTTIKLRAWADGTAEPTSWQLTVTSTTAALQASGGIGLRAYLPTTTTNGPVIFKFDDLVAKTL